jgi:hypothetical protein
MPGTGSPDRVAEPGRRTGRMGRMGRMGWPRSDRLSQARDVSEVRLHWFATIGLSTASLQIAESETAGSSSALTGESRSSPSDPEPSLRPGRTSSSSINGTRHCIVRISEPQAGLCATASRVSKLGGSGWRSTTEAWIAMKAAFSSIDSSSVSLKPSHWSA